MRTAILMLPLFLVACQREPQTTTATEPPPRDQPQSQPQSQPESQPSDTAKAPTGNDELLSAESTDLGGISVASPLAWTTQTPSSNMRRAQYVANGDAGPAECVVFFFGGGAGTIDANITRWCGQFAQADGSNSRDHAEIATVDVNGHEVTTLSLTGRYIAETQPGSGQRVDHADWAIRAAIVPTAAGAFYFKMTGPESTINEQAEAFDAMIASIS